MNFGIQNYHFHRKTSDTDLSKPCITSDYDLYQILNNNLNGAVKKIRVSLRVMSTQNFKKIRVFEYWEFGLDPYKPN